MQRPGHVDSTATPHQAYHIGLREHGIDDIDMGPIHAEHQAHDLLATSPLKVSDRIVLPALVNAHDHARNLRSATLGAWGQPLETWLPFLGVVPGVDPYVAAATSFCRSVRGGATSVMVHYTRAQGTCDWLEEALAVAKAARDVGIRIGFAVAMRDRHFLAYADDSETLKALRPEIQEAVRERLWAKPLPAQEQVARVRALAQAIESDPSLAAHVSVQYGPTGVQWCSDELLMCIAKASQEDQRPVHMHLLETRYQRAWADQTHRLGIVPHLDAIGLLSERLTLAHCTWARPGEVEVLAEKGVTVAVNTSSNLQLRSGLAPVAAMHRAGCRLAMGLDGLALDEDDDALREWRLLSMLHRGWGFEDTLNDAQLWRMVAVNGRRSVLGLSKDQAKPGGLVQSGHAADLMVLDRALLDEDDAIVAGVNPWHLIMARSNAQHIQSVVAMGRLVVCDRKVLGVQEIELRQEYLSQLRHIMQSDSQWTAWKSTLEAMSQDLKAWYQNHPWMGCC